MLDTHCFFRPVSEIQNDNPMLSLAHQSHWIHPGRCHVSRMRVVFVTVRSVGPRLRPCNLTISPLYCLTISLIIPLQSKLKLFSRLVIEQLKQLVLFVGGQLRDQGSPSHVISDLSLSKTIPPTQRMQTTNRVFRPHVSRLHTSSRISSNSLPASFMRGGTSKGIYLKAEDVPDQNKWPDVGLGVLSVLASGVTPLY